MQNAWQGHVHQWQGASTDEKITSALCAYCRMLHGECAFEGPSFECESPTLHPADQLFLGAVGDTGHAKLTCCSS